MTNAEVGSGTVLRESRQIAEFDRVSILGSATVEILASQSETKCEVEYDDNLLQYVSTSVEDNHLKITFEKSTTSSHRLRIWLSTPHLSRLSVSGSANGTVENLEEPKFEIDVSGSAKVECKGKVDELTLKASGSATFNCLELIAEDVNVGITGSGSANVQAANRLVVKISGAGKVRYEGSPEVEKSITGAGFVEAIAKQTE